MGKHERDKSDVAQTLDGATDVLTKVAATRDMKDEHPLIADQFEESTLRQIAALAWRHQFSADRYGFRKDIREMQEYVTTKALNARRDKA